jgi:hypothetical protein
MRMKRWVVLGLLTALVWGCGDDEAPDPTVEPEGPAADACEHLEEGPFNDVTAGADAAGAPNVSATHTKHRITLLDDGSGSYGGFVAIEADEAAEILIFLDGPVAIAVQDAQGAGLSLEQEPSCPGDGCAEACPAVKNHVAVDVASVGTYYVALGPTAASEVSLVHFEAAGHEH